MRTLAAIAIAMLAASPVLASTADKPVEVMVVGTFHMSNPGRDIHNVHADDVLAPKRQKEIRAVLDGLARFKPTMVAVEQDAPEGNDFRLPRYHDYLKGDLRKSRNEVVQLGFRTAKLAGLKDVYAIDADGDFPFEALANFAQRNNQADFLQKADATVTEAVKQIQEKLDSSTIGATLRHLNDPARIAADNGFYRETLRIGKGKEQPGAALEAAWYARNFQICARLVQSAKPGDRVIVFYGSGHSFLLRQCVSEMPGYKLIEANDYLPQ
jgi:hypothetical protein